MRIAVTSLDGIGDVMLRQPLFSTLAEAGHQLLIICRRYAVTLVRQMVPSAQVMGLSCDPYKMTQARDARFPAEILRRIEAFSPKLLVVAPYQWTIFEDYIASSLSYIPTMGLSGYAYEADARPANDPLPPFSPQQRINAAEAMPELQKNELLCQAILGQPVSLPLPRLVATDEQRNLAREFLSQSGIAAESHWICCVGQSDDYYSQLRSWSRDQWIAALRQIAQRSGTPLILVGSDEDRDALLWIKERLGGAPGSVAVATNPWGELDLLIGLTAHSCGYIGHDTGPMHIAAALGKPVVAVFGGGTWPRFLPAVEPSRVLTVKVPCQGCGWFCHMEESFCIKRVPVQEVVQAVDDLCAQRVMGREIRSIEPAATMWTEMVQAGVAAERRKRYVVREQHKIAAEAIRESQAQLNALIGAKDTPAGIAPSLQNGAGLPRTQNRTHASQGEVIMISETQGTLEQRVAQYAADAQRDAERLEHATGLVARLRAEVDGLIQAASARALEYESQESKLKGQLTSLQTELRQTQYARSQLSGALARSEMEHRTMLEGLEQITRQNQQLQAQLQQARAQNDQLARERDEHAGHARELSQSRSRRMLLKLNLVTRCPWETD